MVVEAKSYLTAPIEWSFGDDPEYPYEAKYEGHRLLVRLNDFPETELYALIADGEEITNFDEWPNSWIRPSVSEKNYQDRFVTSERIKGTRKLTEGFFISLLAPDANSPEILSEKEAASFREQVRADVYLGVNRELDSSSPTDIRVVTCWRAGMDLKQISAVTGMPVSTIQRHLIAWQKRVLKKIGLKDEKEAAALHEKLRADVYLGVKRELDNSSPTDIRVVTCWGSGMSLKQISAVTGISISTVQRHLKAWQNRVLEKIDLHQIVNENLELRTVIRNAAKKFTRAA